MTYLHGLGIGGSLTVVLGIVLLVVARRQDARNYIIQKATPMPLHLVNVRDDVWLRGAAECASPLSTPHFTDAALFFEYTLEERVRETETDEEGNVREETRWETRERREAAARFALREGAQTIAIDGAAASFQDLERRADQVGDWRHTVTFFPYPAEISAVGSVGEGRARLEPHANIPLLITTRDRASFVQASERGETLLRVFGGLLLWLGVGAVAYGLLDHWCWPAPTGGRFQAATLLAAAGPATVVFLLVWAIYLYNTFVLYRHRVENAWRQIDVDLRMRWDLLPQLVSGVQGYLTHERELFARVTALRGQGADDDAASRIDAEDEVAAATGRLLAVIEAYPDLRAQPLVSRLMREMTALEEKIAHGRSFYNGTVREYNDNVMVFPRGVLARMCGFRAHGYFTSEPDAHATPRVTDQT